jgi:hypothetical protein
MKPAVLLLLLVDRAHAGCDATCYGATCDHWSTEGLTCAVLEGDWSCDCEGCECPLHCGRDLENCNHIKNGEFSEYAEGHCCTEGYQCYAKNEDFAQCRSSCKEGEGWLCEETCAAKNKLCKTEEDGEEMQCCDGTHKCFAKNAKKSKCKRACPEGWACQESCTPHFGNCNDWKDDPSSGQCCEASDYCFAKTPVYSQCRSSCPNSPEWLCSHGGKAEEEEEEANETEDEEEATPICDTTELLTIGASVLTDDCQTTLAAGLLEGADLSLEDDICPCYLEITPEYFESLSCYALETDVTTVLEDIATCKAAKMCNQAEFPEMLALLSEDCQVTLGSALLYGAELSFEDDVCPCYVEVPSTLYDSLSCYWDETHDTTVLEDIHTCMELDEEDEEDEEVDWI